MSALALVLAVAIGVSLGLLGGGGSVLAVPVLAYVVGLPPKEAIATSLVVVGATSLFGLVGHLSARNVDVRAALMFGAASMAASFAGGQLAALIPGWMQLTIFALVMMGAAISMLRRHVPVEHEGNVSAAAVLLAAAGTGVLTGVVGVAEAS